MQNGSGIDGSYLILKDRLTRRKQKKELISMNVMTLPKDNELYCRSQKVFQAEKLMIGDYNIAEIVEKVHGNSKM